MMISRELLAIAPRPWRRHGDDTIVDRDGHPVLQADPDCRLHDAIVHGLADLVIALVNTAKP
ncbi:MAG TPA: hypothetical protein VGF92_03980 [Stellaceae bacterium]|jgi:hypothetical protein